LEHHAYLGLFAAQWRRVKLVKAAVGSLYPIAILDIQSPASRFKMMINLRNVDLPDPDGPSSVIIHALHFEMSLQDLDMPEALAYVQRLDHGTSVWGCVVVPTVASLVLSFAVVIALRRLLRAARNRTR